MNIYSSVERAAQIVLSAITLADASVFGQGASGRGVSACMAPLKRLG